jgi:hypothetical protein
MTNKLELDYAPSVDNILAVLDRATPKQVVEGMNWYADAHSFARTLDRRYTRAAGIIAALSPQTSWATNRMLATRAYADGTASGSLGASCAKADAILSGLAPLDVLGGDKVRSFFDNIARPKTSQAVTIDRHAHDIAVYQRMMSAPRQLLTRKGGYEMFADLYREAAGTVGILPLQVQAITWVVWRAEGPRND